MGNNKLPLNSIRRSLKDCVNCDLTQESIVYVRDTIDNLLFQLGEDSIKELDELNRSRQIQRLPKLKRCPVTIFIKLLDELFKPTPDFNIGEVGNYNRNTTFPTEAIEVV